MKRRSVLVLGALTLLLAGGVQALRSPQTETAQLPVIRPGDLRPQWLSEDALRADTSETFPAFTLTDQSGHSLTRADLYGHIVVANFFYTGCSTLCPKLRSGMGQVRDAFAGSDHVRLLSHSVTPEIDSPRVLAAYAKTNAIDGKQWKLLTGARDVINRVAHEGYLVPPLRTGEGNVLHTEWIVLLDDHQRVRGLYNGTLALEIDWLIRDIHTLLGDAGRAT